ALEKNLPTGKPVAPKGISKFAMPTQWLGYFLVAAILAGVSYTVINKVLNNKKANGNTELTIQQTNNQNGINNGATNNENKIAPANIQPPTTATEEIVQKNAGDETNKNATTKSLPVSSNQSKGIVQKEQLNGNGN